MAAARRRSTHASACEGERKDDCGLSFNVRRAVSLPCKAALPPPSLGSSPKYLPLVPSGFLCIVCPLFMAVSWLLGGGGGAETHNALARLWTSREEGRISRYH